MHYDFKRDFRRSRANERLLMEIFEKNDSVKKVRPVEKKLQVWGDLNVEYKDGREIFIEAKEDFMCKHTRNLAIECKCRGNASGIAISRAHLWAITAHTKEGIEILLIPTNKLRDLIDEKRYKRLHTTGGDSGSNTHNYLFDKDVIKEYSTVLYSERKG